MSTYEAMMPVPESGEVFTHDDGNGNVRTFAVCMMNNFFERYGHFKTPEITLALLPIDPNHIEHVKKNMGIEQDRLDRLDDEHLYQPCLGVWMMHEGKKHVVIVDGNHRLVKLHGLGVTKYRCVIFAQSLWEQFILDPKLPEDWQTRRSGVIEQERQKA